MNQRNTLKAIHLTSTIWFMVCMGYLFALTLRQAGFNWWIIFSLSGHLAISVMLLVSLYLFSIFRGIGDSFTMQIEHSLTSSMYYTAFYVSTPLLGGIAGLLGMIGETKTDALLGGIALGTIGATFLTWIVVDCVVGSVEMLLPASREHRFQRLDADKRQREERQRDREALLSQLFAQQEQDRLRWEAILIPDAEKLALLLQANSANFEQAERQAVDIGVRVWQLGGLDCMRRLHDMSLELHKEKYQNLTITDHISSWWDGIGGWRNTAVGFFCLPT
jgi:hypothetical protein